MNSQFILNYTGQKFKETKELDEIDFSKYETIIEPFGGSFGFSRYLYEMKGLKDIEYIVYDNDEVLIDFYNYIKQLLIDDKFDDFINKYNNIMEDIFNQFKTGKDNSQIKLKPSTIYLETLNINKSLRYLIKKNIMSIIPRVYYKKKLKFLDMIKTTTFIHSNFNRQEIMKYDKETTLFYLDPPYLLEDNTLYNNIDDMKTFYEDIIYLFENNKTIFIHSYNYLLNYVFGKYKQLQYTKRYGNSGKVVQHFVYGTY
jgi:site-specific DNA-adenine methylase